MKRSVRTLMATVLTATLAASPSLAAEKPEKFTVGLVNWIGYTGLFVGEEKGYFTEAGLEVENKVFSSPGDMVVPVMNGDLDIAFTTLDVVIKADDKAPGALKILPFLVDASRGADAFIAKPQYTSVKDLKGKQIAATIGECNHLLLLKALEAASMKESDIELVNMNPDDAGTAFAAGRLDGAVTWEPWITKATNAGQGHVVFSSKDAPYVVMDVLIVSPKHARRAQVDAFLRGMVRAHEFIAANPTEAAAIAAKAFELTPEEAAAMLGKVKLFSKPESLSELGTAQAPGPMISATKDLVDFFLARKVIAKPLAPWSLYDMSYFKS